jgi:hypothetical protein
VDIINQAVDDYLRAERKKTGEFRFTGKASRGADRREQARPPQPWMDLMDHSPGNHNERPFSSR